MNIFKKKNIYFILTVCLLLNIAFCGALVKATEDNSLKVFYLNDKQSLSGTLFTSDELIGPGDKLVKEFYIANDKNFKCFLKNISMENKFYSKDNKVLNKEELEYKEYIKNCSISFYCEEQLIYSGNIEEDLLFDLTGCNSIEISQNSKKKFIIEYELSNDVDRIIMGMKHKFDIDFNFSSIDSAGNDYSKTPIIEKVVTGVPLVQTGFIIDTKTLLILGTIICIIGIIFLSKRKTNN